MIASYLGKSSVSVRSVMIFGGSAIAEMVAATLSKNGISVKIVEKQKKTGLYLSDSNYLNFYRFALSLNGRYSDISTADEMKKAFKKYI